MPEFSLNPHRIALPNHESSSWEWASDGDPIAFHRSLRDYAPTPVHRLNGLAKRLGVAEICVKDESQRFGLQSFKPLGASYAVARLACNHLRESGVGEVSPEEIFAQPPRHTFSFAVCTATDGNHGRAVAWAARQIGVRSTVYVPSQTVPARIENIEAQGATVIRVDGKYSDAVKRASRDAEQNGWYVVSDTSDSENATVTGLAMRGYMTLYAELDDQLHGPSSAGVDLVIVQAGVGGLAAAGAAHYVQRYGKQRPTLVCVEPRSADGCLESIKTPHGEAVASRGEEDSLMAGLNCSKPSASAWPVVRECFDAFLAIEDSWALDAMRIYACPDDDDVPIVSGESGAAGLGGLLALLRDDTLAEAARHLNIDSDTRILLINTEGDTDPEHYRSVVSNA